MNRLIILSFLLALTRAQNASLPFCWGHWIRLVPAQPISNSADAPPPGLMGEPKVADCDQAFSIMQHEARYSQSMTYTRDPTNGTSNSTTLLPLSWKYQTCLITFDTSSADAQEKFTIASLMPSMSLTLLDCVEKQPEGWRWGGTDLVGPPELGFYVSVQYNDGFQGPDPFRLVIHGGQLLNTGNMTGQELKGLSTS